MILSFKTKINRKPTYFPEKIITGLFHEKIISKEKAIELFYPEALMKLIPMEYHNTKHDVAISQIRFDNSVNHLPKIHTIRRDEKNRWKPGNKIDFFINARTKDMFRFAPIIPVVSIQKIEFYWWKPENPELYPNPYDDKINGRYCDLYIDGQVQMIEEVNILAGNDGFESVEAFFQYFNEDFTGKIIHWTNLKY